MEKRKFEKLGIETSLLGFGCMRFPATPDGKIDEPRAEKLLDRAIGSRCQLHRHRVSVP